MLSKRLEDFYFKIYIYIENNKLITSIRQGCIMTMPMFIIGSFALVFQNFPIEVVKDFITNFANGTLLSFFQITYDATFGMASLYILAAITYKYSVSLTKRTSTINFIAIIVAIISYITLLGDKPMLNMNGVDGKAVPLMYTDVRNVFSAVFVAICATRIFIKSYLLMIKKKNLILADVEVRNTVSTIFPTILTVTFFALITILIKTVTPYTGFNQMIIATITIPFKNIGRNLISTVLVLLFQSILWFFGIHGSNTFESVNLSLFVDASGEIFTKTFLDVFVLMGGCGTAICLLIVLALFSKNQNSRGLVRKAFFPMVFNINEILIFGLPIVLNPMFIIPFVLTPVVCMFISYFAIRVGIVPMAVHTVFWTEPVLFSGYSATGSVAGTLLQLFNIIVGVLIYLPFVRLNDKMQKRHFERTVETMTEMMQQSEKDNVIIEFAKMPNDISKTAQEMAESLIRDIGNNNISMYYQPQISNEDKVVSGEALLRWNCGLEYNLYPPLVVAIAKEYNHYDTLTKYIVEEVLTDIKTLQVDFDIVNHTSINIEAYQLMDKEFISWVIQKSKEYAIPNYSLGLEITENAELLESEGLPEIFAMLRKNHISIAIDDFSMGSTSLHYLQSNNFDFVKLDGAIINNLLVNERSREIIDSIIALGKTLDFEIIAEYVETIEQKKELERMGCYIYQGYLYSPAVPLFDYIRFIQKLNIK